MLPRAVRLPTSCPWVSNFHGNSKHFVCLHRNASLDNDGKLITLAETEVQACAVHNPAMARDHDELYQRLFDATDLLATNAGYLEASCDPPTFWWDYYDYDVEAQWLDDGGTFEARPSTTAPPELVQRLRAVTAEHGVPCDLRACVPHAPVDPGFDAAYAKWLSNEGPCGAAPGDGV
jgi:hypothetical protein